MRANGTALPGKPAVTRGSVAAGRSSAERPRRRCGNEDPNSQLWLCLALRGSAVLLDRAQQREASSWRQPDVPNRNETSFSIFHVAHPQDTAENGPQSTTANNISMAVSELLSVRSPPEARLLSLCHHQTRSLPSHGCDIHSILKASMLSTSLLSLLCPQEQRGSVYVRKMQEKLKRTRLTVFRS